MERLLAVYMSHPTGAPVSEGPGVLLSDGRCIFAHRGGISVYRDEAAALRENPGTTIHRMPGADDAVNP